MAGKRKLGGSHTTNKAEPRGKKPSTTAGAGGDDSKKGGKKQQQQQLHNDAAERAAAKALARAAQGRVEAGEQDDASSSSFSSSSAYDYDDAEAAALMAAAEGRYGESSSDDDSSGDDEEGSEDDIKMYGAGEEEDEDASSSSSESGGEGEAKGKAKGKAAAAAAAKGKGANGKGKGEEEAEAAAAAAAKKKGGKDKESGVAGVEVSFEFSDPGERFFFGTRALLQWLKDEGVDTTALAELIGQEKGLGTVVHCAGEDDVFALASTLNVRAHLEAGDAGMASLVALLRGKCPRALQPTLEAALTSPETYIFLHARFVNLPLPLVPLLHQSGEEDRAWAQASDPDLPRVRTLITLSPCAVDVGSGASALPYAPNDAIYDRFEDELLVQAAEASYCAGRSAAAAAEEGEKGKGKKGKGASAGASSSSSSSLGYVVSLVKGSAVAEILPQIEEMVQ